MRILVEFYSHRTPENLISLLKERYDGVLFLYFETANKPKDSVEQQLIQTVEGRFGFKPRFISVPKNSISSVLEVLETLDPQNSYDFDITGGGEIFIAAAGIFLERKKGRDLSIHQYNVRDGSLIFRYPKERETESFFPLFLNVPETFYLNGAKPLSTPSYQLSLFPLRNEILRLWNAVKSCPKDWNRFCSIPGDPEKQYQPSLTQKYLGGNPQSRQWYDLISQKLKKADILKDEKFILIDGKEYVTFQLNVDPTAKFLYEKAGNLLEMYVALAAHDSGRFHDVRVGVTLDWNGTSEPHLPYREPTNEIDLVLMHNNLPVLASCKNTAPENEFLYEIMIMSKHYGGFFSTPMLFSSDLATPTVRQRAGEMGVVLVDGITKMGFPALVARLQKEFS